MGFQGTRLLRAKSLVGKYLVVCPFWPNRPQTESLPKAPSSCVRHTWYRLLIWVLFIITLTQLRGAFGLVEDHCPGLPNCNPGPLGVSMYVCIYVCMSEMCLVCVTNVYMHAFVIICVCMYVLAM